jgi:superfamily I DNA and/or RNA helicase
VIIDEASQSDVMALVALYLGASVVVVGDHEQVSPSAVGQEIAVVQNLIDQFLQGIPNAHLYDGQTSVYDLARQSFGGTIRLVEHFRCVSEIIQFSNELSYDGDIKPLRDASRVVLKPHTIAYRVQGSTRDGKVNRQEAEVTASLAVAALEQPEYQKNEFGDRTSFGVVSLVGEEQALEIDRLLRTHIPPDLYERHRFLCGTPAQFQGDERDVVFLSVVDTSTGSPLPFRDQQMFKQRYNVAASRARDQM